MAWRWPWQKPEQKGAGLIIPPQYFDLPGSPYREGIPGIRLWSAYRLYALAYACMRFRATKLAEAVIGVQQESQDGWEWLTKHGLSGVLSEPNPDMDMGELVELTSLYLDTAGLCVWHKWRDRAGRAMRLYPYHRDEVDIRPAGDRVFGSFTLRTAQGPVTVGPEEVVLFRSANPEDWRTGTGPLEAALAHVNIGHDMRRAITSSLKNAVRPGATMEVPDGFPTEDDARRFSETVQQRYAGVVNEGKVMIVERGSLKPWESQLSKLELGPVQGDVEAAICQCFQVHPALVGARIGLENSSGFADSIGPATDLFYDVFALPTWRKMGSALTRQLLRESDPAPNRRMAFDTSEVRALQDDLDRLTKEATQAAGYWTVDEARIHTGQQPLGDERGEQFVKQPQVGTGQPGQQAEPPKASGEAREGKQVSLREAQRLIEAATRDTEEAALEMVTGALLIEDERAVHAALGTDAKAEDDPPIPPSKREALENRVIRAIEGRIAQWERALAPALESVGKRSITRVAAALGLDTGLLEPGLLDFVAEEGADLVTLVSDTTKDNLRRAIGESFEAGEGIRGMATRIRETGSFSRDRAKLIAITETTRTRNGASLRGMQEYQKQVADSGIVTTKEWMNSGDNKVRKAHRDTPVGVGGEVRKLDEAFSNGLQQPSEPNCRCGLVYDVNVEE